MVMPKFIREQKSVHKFMTLKQEGERLHKTLNELETQFRNVRDKSERYFLMKKEYTNRLNINVAEVEAKKN